MIDHKIASAIKLPKERKAYFVENAEVGDRVRAGFGDAEYIILAVRGIYYWAQKDNGEPMTLYAKDMYGIKEG